MGDTFLVTVPTRVHLSTGHVCTRQQGLALICILPASFGKLGSRSNQTLVNKGPRKLKYDSRTKEFLVLEAIKASVAIRPSMLL